MFIDFFCLSFVRVRRVLPFLFSFQNPVESFFTFCFALFFPPFVVKINPLLCVDKKKVLFQIEKRWKMNKQTGCCTFFFAQKGKKKIVFFFLSFSVHPLSLPNTHESTFYSAAGAFFDAAFADLDARSSAEALAAAARLRSGRRDAAALPADAATRLGEIFFETDVDERLAGFEAFLGRETVTATPPPGAAVTSTVLSLARPGGVLCCC